MYTHKEGQINLKGIETSLSTHFLSISLEHLISFLTILFESDA